MSMHTSEQPRVWTVIVNWQRPDDTAACLESLLQGVTPDTVLVIDNGSPDDSVRRLQQQFPAVRILPLNANMGFARASNIGISLALQAQADAVLLLNNDTLVTATTVQQLAAWLHASPRRGIVSPKIFLSDHPGHLWAVGGRFTGRRSISLGEGEQDQGQYDTAVLDFVYGCAMLLSARMLRDIGAFDERFFMYFEDVDLCLRARAAGYEIAFAPHIHIEHKGARSTSHLPALKVFYMARSRMLFFQRHLRPGEKPLFYAEELRYTLVLLARLLLAGDMRGAAATVTGRLAALLPAGWKGAIGR